MRKSIALFGCLALLSAPLAAHAESSTTSTPSGGIMPGNGSTISNGPESSYDNTTTGSVMPLGGTEAPPTAATARPRNQTYYHHRHTSSTRYNVPGDENDMDRPNSNMDMNNYSSDPNMGVQGNNGSPGRGRY